MSASNNRQSFATGRSSMPVTSITAVFQAFIQFIEWDISWGYILTIEHFLVISTQ